MSVTIARHHAQTELEAASEAGRLERLEQVDDLMSMCALAMRTVERSGDLDAIRRVRHARSLLSELLNLSDV